MNPMDKWRELVRAEHEQTDRIRGFRPSDHWANNPSLFRGTPNPTGDIVVEAALSRIMPGETLLDVGSGGGRFALPLAASCRTVTAVDPSPTMCGVLRQSLAEYHIANVSIIEAGWLDACVETADVVLCSHVAYFIEDIESFVRKLDNRASRRVLIVLFQSAPQSPMYGLWEQVHGEKRHGLPALPEFLPVLRHLGIGPEVTELGELPRRGFSTLEEARDTIARRIFVAPETEAMERLEIALEDWLVHEDGAWQIQGAQPFRPNLIVWEGGELM